MRLRVRYTKLGKVRFVGHRDVATIWERGLRRANLLAVYSQGFTPRPKFAFGLALPTCAESDAEFLDVELVEPIEPGAFARQMSLVLPEGIDVVAVEVVERDDISLQEDVVACRWKLTLRDVEAADVERDVCLALAATNLKISRDRKGERSVDEVRPAIEQLDVATGSDGSVTLTATLATKPRGLRPSELLAVVLADETLHGDRDGREIRVFRSGQMIERNGARRELLPVDATNVQPPE